MRIRTALPLRNALICAASTLALAGVCATPTLAATAAKPAAPAATPTRLTLSDDVTPDHYDIAVAPNAKALSFAGDETITVTVHKPVRSITLNAADITFGQVKLDERADKPQITQDTEQQTARFTFASPLAVGRHKLHIDYTGKIYQQASGLFALDYDTAHGKARALFTQFENSDARRFAPSFDEPGKKATFTLTAVTPADQMAISNMPVAASTTLPGGLKRVRFAETPKMSSYLLFFGMGDFERVSKKVDGVDIGVVVKRGDTAEAQFALDAASEILPYYNTYFGTKFPLPKMDLIGGPGSSQFFGAMENWGAIFYFERDLLIDPRTATEDDRQNVYIVVAHEMAHQWFGDLVTMNWWDDLWLNEGFASWMENKVTDHYHPEWKVWLQQLNAKQRAMQVDAKDGTHPVITPIYDVLQASGAFDDITYDKGASVIRMLESYTGEDAWRAGIRNYIAHHAYGNAVTNDLWREIDAVSPRKITDIAHDFTLQPGVPMVKVDGSGCANGQGGLKLTPDQFYSAPAPAKGQWRVPLKLQGQGLDQTLVLGAAQTVGGGCAAVVNSGQTSYVRALYAGAEAAKIADLYPQLSPDDQLGVLNDTSAEANAGYVPMGDFMTLSAKLPNGADPVVWLGLANQLAGLDRLYDGLPTEAQFRAYALSRLRPELERLGWDARPTDPVNTAGERTAVLAVMGRMGDPAVIAEAHKRFEALARGERLDPTVRRAVLSIVALNADAATWEEIHALAKKAPTALEKTEFYTLLGRARDPALAQRALDLALSGETEPTTAPAIISAVAGAHPKLGLDFAIAHWAQVEPLLDSSARIGYISRLASSASDLSVADDLDAFAQAHIEPGARGDVRKTRAQIEYNAKVRTQRLPEIDRWLSGRGS
jgi:aminopeptidase N